MNGKQPRNMAASIRQRLSNHARINGEDFQYVLTRYGLERLLYRLSRSSHADMFVLKGAVLLQLWSNQPHRPTRDLDLLGRGKPSTDRFEQLFRDICAYPSMTTAWHSIARTYAQTRIKEDDEYEGIRVRLDARLGDARIPLQVDIGFGDAITPEAVDIVYPTLLDQPAPTVRAYPRETVVAEKFQAMVTLGIANSRMKDFYDLWILATQFEFDGTTICQALQATFSRRQTDLPTETPLALTQEFATDRNKATQWLAFLRKGRLLDEALPLSDVINLLAPFLFDPTRSFIGGEPFTLRWPPGGPWRSV